MLCLSSAALALMENRQDIDIFESTTESVWGEKQTLMMFFSLEALTQTRSYVGGAGTRVIFDATQNTLNPFWWQYNKNFTCSTCFGTFFCELQCLLGQ